MHMNFRDPEKRTDLRLGESACWPKYPYGINHIVGKFSQVAVFSMLKIKPNSSGVTVVVGIACPFQVFVMVVVLVSVFVINSPGPLRSWADKCCCDQLVNSNYSARQWYGWISLLRFWREKMFAFLIAAAVFIGNRSGIGLYPAMRRNFVYAVKAINLLPNFYVVHTGRPRCL